MADCVSFMNLNMILSLLLFAISVIIPVFHIIFADKRFSWPNIPEIMIKYSLFFNVGCLFITGFAGQFLYAQEISSCIGWSWSPFQYELAFSELGLGILGLISPIFHKEFWLATIIGAVVWFLGGSAVHLYYLIQGNESILNASFVIVWNIFLALWLIGFYLALCKAWQKARSLLRLGLEPEDTSIKTKMQEFN